MDRRNLLKSSAILAGASVASSAFAGKKHHMGKTKIPHILRKSQVRDLVRTTQECIDDGRVCLAHCTRDLATGDTMMAKCNAIVQNMLVACEGLNSIAHQNSLEIDAFKAYIKACLDICELCYQECKKHEGHHKECKDCMRSCAKCIKVCKAILG